MLIVEQALFGYSNGHKLLASSMEIQPKILKILEPLTDWSGVDFNKDFSEYITGYFFKDEKLLALSKTWYAQEMSRPGCVWSHVLFINMSNYDIDINLTILMKYFIKPNQVDDFSMYKEKIVLEDLTYDISYNDIIDTFNYDIMKKIILAEYEYYYPIIIPSTSSEQFNSIFFYLWLALGNNILKNISFCTGSLVNRMVNKKPIDFQVVPINKAKTILRTTKIGVNIDEISFIKHTWVDLIMKAYIFRTDRRLIEFINHISIDRDNKYVICSCAKILDRIQQNNISISLLISSLSKELNVETQRYICTYTIMEILNANKYSELFYVDETDKQIDFIKELLILDESTHDIIDFCKISNNLNSFNFKNIIVVKDLFNYIINSEVNQFGKTFIKLIANYVVEQNQVKNVLSENFNGCYLLVNVNPLVALNDDIWTAPINEQLRILDVLYKSDVSKNEQFLEELAFNIFSNSCKKVLEKTYELFGKKIVKYYLLWCNKTSDNNRKIHWVTICKYDIEFCLEFLKNNDNQFLEDYIWKFIDPYTVIISSIDTFYWVEYYRNCLKEKNDIKVKEEFACFILPIIIRGNHDFPEDLTYFAFKTVHTILSKDVMEYKEWIKLSKIIPEIAWNNNWDKCKRLRKAAKKLGYSYNL